MPEEHMPRVVTITKIIDRTPTIKTFIFDESFNFRPGQFCMIWIPGVDEIPMAFSASNSITVMRVGDATTALFNLKEGDKIGIRGPLGNGFSPNGNVLAIGGGIGVTPLFSLATESKVETFILGARTSKELVFVDELTNISELKIATDDGTRGFHGFVTDILDQMDVTEYDTICVCGPEQMMKGILDRLTTKGIEKRGQFSLHRYMKCGVGICGSCCMDHEGFRVCRDGPIFTGNMLKNSEFAHHYRGPSGKREG
ncbi:MAG TPA: dihydroorotate dehydrogenase electron transfer subunit [Methanocorpusculum sp.]|nr:dihydroorotate dehydrogenase electron transfer subunit [Methanocorpusculum sp.]